MTASFHVQLCGPLVVKADGVRREDELPGRQGRALAAYLLAHRTRTVTRDELVDALWPADAPAGADATLSTLLSRVRKVVPLAGLRVRLPADAFVDLEAAVEALHEAQSAIAQERFAAAWAPARVALHAVQRGFLTGVDLPWADVRRSEVEQLHVDALDATATVGLALGGAELSGAERAARRLVALAPLRESGHVLLMRAMATRGDVPEALAAYEALRATLRDELGITPGAAAQELHATLETKVNMVRAITASTGEVRAEGTVVHRGGRVATAEARLVGAADGVLLAHGTSTCLIIT